jgi:hypothetical protein
MTWIWVGAWTQSYPQCATSGLYIFQNVIPEDNFYMWNFVSADKA